jgi:hypothetical protein
MNYEYGIYAQKQHTKDYSSVIYRIKDNKMEVLNPKGGWKELKDAYPNCLLIPLNGFENFFDENPFFTVLISHYDENHINRRSNDWYSFIYACKLAQFVQPNLKWDEFFYYLEIFESYDVYDTDVVKVFALNKESANQ